MYKVLVFGMTENPGGVESFLLNYYKNINRDVIQFDFLCNSHEKCAYEDDLVALGATMYHVTARSKNIKKYQEELKALFQRHASEYQAIWVNVNSLANIDYLKLAKKDGIPKRIIHSHNSQNMDSKLRGFLHQWNKKRIDAYATDFWACSQSAADWFYREDLKPRVVQIHNAIDIEKMRFDLEKRAKIREELGLQESDICIGNVGRLHFQKNQKFALQIMERYLQKNPQAKLVLVGQGPDKEELENVCKDLQIQDSVVFAGIQSDIVGWLSAFDLFLFPSLFEGLSIAALEAEANGVPILASKDVITEELKVVNNFTFYSLDHTASEWADKMDEMIHSIGRQDFGQVKKEFVAKEYEIHTEAKKLEKLLMEAR